MKIVVKLDVESDEESLNTKMSPSPRTAFSQAFSVNSLR